MRVGRSSTSGTTERAALEKLYRGPLHKVPPPAPDDDDQCDEIRADLAATGEVYSAFLVLAGKAAERADP